MPRQVIMQLHGTATPSFEAIRNDQNRPTRSFEDREAGRRAPRFGTQDLLALANFAKHRGFELQGFEFEETSGSRLPPVESERVSKGLLKALEKGNVSGASRWLIEYYPMLSVIGVRLLSTDYRMALFGRRGVSELESVDEALELLTRAWEQLHFS